MWVTSRKKLSNLASSLLCFFPLLWYQGFQTEVAPSDNREESNSNTERTWCRTYISLQNTEIRSGVFVTAAQTSLPWLIYSQTQISKDAEYTPYIYNPFVTPLQLTPLRNFHHGFRTRTMKWSILNFTFSLSPCSWPNNSVLMTTPTNNNNKKSVTWDVGSQSVFYFHSPQL